MILGFLGKGGSGKSSVATQATLWLHKNNSNVLAIDADHNMDLAYNLFQGAMPKDMPFFGSKLEVITSHVGLSKEQKYDEAFLSEVDEQFSFEPVDSATNQLSVTNDMGITVMAAGPQTDNVLYGQSCSHSLTTPLKVYLPLLELKENQYVVVDEKAGADGVSTGIVTGIDVGIIVCEPALHSIKTALQIAELMEFYETPYLFVANKIQSSDDKDFISENLGQEPAIYLLESKDIKRNPGKTVQEWDDEMSALIEKAKIASNNNRLERTRKKFSRNREYSS